MKVRRGDVILLEHPFSSGTGAKVRPVLVVQNDRDNARLTNTVVVMITRTIHRAGNLDTQLLIDVSTAEGRSSGLKVTSAIICSNLYTAHEQLIHKRIGSLPTATMSQVDGCLRAVLNLR